VGSADARDFGIQAFEKGAAVGIGGAAEAEAVVETGGEFGREG